MNWKQYLKLHKEVVLMPFKDRQKTIESAHKWRERATERGLCMRCGVKLVEGEGKCCVNCSSKTTRNLIAIARRNV